jgi:hypothetical protein
MSPSNTLLTTARGCGTQYSLAVAAICAVGLPQNLHALWLHADDATVVGVNRCWTAANLPADSLVPVIALWCCVAAGQA